MRNSKLIAPCGMNCSLCAAYQRVKNKCMGCNAHGQHKANHCAVCGIKNCEELLRAKSHFCYSCGKFPCKRIRQMDIRYRTKYGMSMIQNLQTIQERGIHTFMAMEKRKWTCHQCGSFLCVHWGQCLQCGNRNDKYPRAAHSPTACSRPGQRRNPHGAERPRI